jgi:hypothetical protein
MQGGLIDMMGKTVVIFILVLSLSSCATLLEEFAAVIDPPRENTSAERPKSTVIIVDKRETVAANTSTQRANADAANWDIAKLDTARDAAYLSAIEKDVILEMNKVRSDPKKYAELYIKPRLQYFNGNLYSVPGRTTIQTNEGKKAVEG